MNSCWWWWGCGWWHVVTGSGLGSKIRTAAAPKILRLGKFWPTGALVEQCGGWSGKFCPLFLLSSLSTPPPSLPPLPTSALHCNQCGRLCSYLLPRLIWVESWLEADKLVGWFGQFGLWWNLWILLQPLILCSVFLLNVAVAGRIWVLTKLCCCWDACPIWVEE